MYVQSFNGYILYFQQLFHYHHTCAKYYIQRFSDCHNKINIPIIVILRRYGFQIILIQSDGEKLKTQTHLSLSFKTQRKRAKTIQLCLMPLPWGLKYTFTPGR